MGWEGGWDGREDGMGGRMGWEGGWDGREDGMGGREVNHLSDMRVVTSGEYRIKLRKN